MAVDLDLLSFLLFWGYALKSFFITVTSKSIRYATETSPTYSNIVVSGKLVKTMLTASHLLVVGDDLLCDVDTAHHKRLHSTAAGQHRLGVGKASRLTLQAFFFVSFF